MQHDVEVLSNLQALHPVQEDQEVLDLQPHPIRETKSHCSCCLSLSLSLSPFSFSLTLGPGVPSLPDSPAGPYIHQEYKINCQLPTLGHCILSLNAQWSLCKTATSLLQPLSWFTSQVTKLHTI